MLVSARFNKEPSLFSGNWRKTPIYFKLISSLLLLIILAIVSFNKFNLSPVSFNFDHRVNQTVGVSKYKESVHANFHAQQYADQYLTKILKQIVYNEVDLSEAYNNMEMSDLEENAVPGLGLEEQEPLDSKNIDFDRATRDTRDKECSHLNYEIYSLPNFSVVIVFEEINLNGLTQTLENLINKTSAELLKEIIIVDDSSQNIDLHEELEMYILAYLPFSKIRLLRLSKKLGLIRAKMIGAYEASGDVLIFLGDNCKVQEKWSEPLLQRIKENRNTVVVPMIDEFDGETLRSEHNSKHTFMIGGFTWAGEVKWSRILKFEEEMKSDIDPTKTPTIAGGMFAIDRKYFWEIGSFDPDMMTTGGENLEMSLRIWQCGGTIEVIPCSRVIKIFDGDNPNQDEESEKRRNVLRTAAVWMGDYAQFVFERGMMMDFGDITERVKFRRRKKCKSFQWYLDTIYRQLFRLHLDSKLWGQVKNIGSGLCLDVRESEMERYLNIARCDFRKESTQTFYWSYDKELRMEEICARSEWNSTLVRLDSCDITVGDAFKWKFDKLGRLVNYLTNMCLTVIKIYTSKYELTLEKCGFSYLQKWDFEYSELESNI